MTEVKLMCFFWRWVTSSKEIKKEMLIDYSYETSIK